MVLFVVVIVFIKLHAILMVLFLVALLFSKLQTVWIVLLLVAISCRNCILFR
jgi:hypothetical protein